MNKTLVEELKRIEEVDPRYINTLKESDQALKNLIISDLADIGLAINTEEYTGLKNSLYDIFIYLSINSKNPNKYVINNNRTSIVIEDLNTALFAIIASLNEDFVDLPYYEKEIIIICENISQKFFNKSYECFLIDYIEKNN